MTLRVGIVGGGTMGLAAAWALARRGASVTVFERHGHHHELGSHGGFTRVIRHAYHEGSQYVRLVLEADRLWTELAVRCGQSLLVRCGLLEFGATDDPQFEAANAALRAHALPHELLAAPAARQRFPFAVPDEFAACFSPDAGYLRVGPCLDALRDEAVAAGAVVASPVRVREVEPGGEAPTVVLDDGRVFGFDRIVVAVGAWAGKVVAGVLERGPARIAALRRVLAWTTPEPESIPALRAMPVWGAFVPEGFFYGFPHTDEGICGLKLACHENRDPAAAFMDEPVDPDTVQRTVDARDLAPLQRFLARYLPRGAGPVVASKVCMYGSSRSGDFLVDFHPADPTILLVTGFSGHGFKFAPVIGELVADKVQNGESAWSLDVFARASHAL
jgi:monomeric sarcosine oxidase